MRLSECCCCLPWSFVALAQVFEAFAALAPEGGDDRDEAPVFLRRWGAHVNHFLGYFPYPQAKPVILTLVDMRRSLAPFFAPLPAGGKGRTREGVPTVDDAPISTAAAVASPPRDGVVGGEGGKVSSS